MKDFLKNEIRKKYILNKEEIYIQAKKKTKHKQEKFDKAREKYNDDTFILFIILVVLALVSFIVLKLLGYEYKDYRHNTKHHINHTHNRSSKYK